MKNMKNMYNITNLDIHDCIKNCNSAITMKGPIIGYAIANGGKDIENRSRKIKDGWYALHIGGSKNPTLKHSVIYSLLDDLDEKKFPPRSSIIGCMKIEGYVTESNNKWFFGPYGSKIIKYIKFNEPIIGIPGHQSITYRLDTIDKKLYKKNKNYNDKIKDKIEKKLRSLLV